MIKDFVTYMYYNGKNDKVIIDLIRKGYRVCLVTKNNQLTKPVQLTLFDK